MVTGIVTDIGRIVETKVTGDLRARIATGYDVGRIDIGASIACDGVCLTVVALGPEGWFDVEISGETVSKTNVGRWAAGKRVNLERALKVGDELGGHIVSGHVDAVGKVADWEPEGDSMRVTIVAPKALAPFIAAKGSITVDGVSLTVNSIRDYPDGSVHFGLNVIPHTAEVTTLGELAQGSEVNLEIDTVARYLQRLESLRA